MNTGILICTNGYEGTWPAIEYGAWAADCIEEPVVLLGIAEESRSAPIDVESALEHISARAVELFKAKGLRYSVEIQKGKAEEVIPREARRADCITVLGPLGRPRLRRFLLGRSIHGLMEEIATPILYVPRVCLPLRTMLVCLGGLGYELTAEHLAVRLGVVTKAEVTLLHVAPPVDLDYPTARAESEHWRDLVSTDTLPGRNLRRALEMARTAGLAASIKARQGNVVEEILAEIKLGEYDLICMGSAHSGHGLRQLSEPNITDEIAEQVSCPVLTARHIPEPDGQKNDRKAG